MTGKKDTKDLVAAWEKLGISPTSIGQVDKILDIACAMVPRFTVCLVGETGIGKSPVVEQWTQSRGGICFKLNFGHLSSEDIGMIMFSEKGDSFDFVVPEYLLRVNAAAKKDGIAVLFLDEWNRGEKALVNGLFTLTDERRIHSFDLHPNVLVVAAMNPSDGSYLVNEAEKDHAIRKRLNFIYVTHDLNALLDVAKKTGWHPLVPAFLKAASNFVYDAGARDAGKCFPCPCNWEKVSTILKAAEVRKIDLTATPVYAMVQGQIGSVATRKFMDFVADQNTMIQPIEVLTKYNLANGRTRHRVAALLEGNRTDILTELNRGIAIELFSSTPKPEDICDHLAEYIGDLPNELLSAFAADNLFEQAQNRGEPGQVYLNQLSNELRLRPAYKRKMKIIIDAMKTWKKKAGLIAGKDPIED